MRNIRCKSTISILDLACIKVRDSCIGSLYIMSLVFLCEAEKEKEWKKDIILEKKRA